MRQLARERGRLLASGTSPWLATRLQPLHCLAQKLASPARGGSGNRAGEAEKLGSWGEEGALPSKARGLETRAS